MSDVKMLLGKKRDGYMPLPKHLYRSVSVGLGGGLISVLLSSTSFAVSIEDAVRTALQTNPDVGIVVEDRRAVGYELKQAGARYKPTVDFSAGAGHQYTNDTSTRAGRSANNGSPYDSMNRYESGLSLSQMLFDGYETDSEVARQESRVVSAARRVRETSELVALDVAEAYLEAQRQRELMELSLDNVTMHEATLSLVSLKVDGGAATIADQQQATSRLASAEAALEDAKARLRDADATFNRIIGETPRDLERPTAPFWALPQSVDEAIDIAIGNNPTVAVAKADLDTTISEYRTTKAGYYPTLNLELGADANRNVDGTRGADYNMEAMLRLTYNLYRGGEDVYKRQEFLSRIAESRQFYNRSVRLTEEEMRLSWNARESSVAQVRAQRREVEANDIVRKTYRQQFDLGGRSLLELLDSENEYFFAKTNLISTEFQSIFSVFRILATGGVLLSTLDVRAPFESKTELDPVLPMAIDLELREGVDPNADPILGDVLPEASAPSLGLDSLLDGMEDTLDPNVLELDPNALGLDPNAMELDPNALELDPNAMELDPSALEPDPGTLELESDVAVLDPNVMELDPKASLLPSDVKAEDPDLLIPEPLESLLDPNLEIMEAESLEIDVDALLLDAEVSSVIPIDIEQSLGGEELPAVKLEESLLSEATVNPTALDIAVVADDKIIVPESLAALGSVSSVGEGLGQEDGLDVDLTPQASQDLLGVSRSSDSFFASALETAVADLQEIALLRSELPLISTVERGQTAVSLPPALNYGAFEGSGTSAPVPLFSPEPPVFE